MFTRRKIVVATFLCLTVFAGAASAYVEVTIAQLKKNPPCGRLTGLKGILLKTKFISPGTCTINPGGTCKAPASTCLIQTVVRNPDPTGPPTIIVTTDGHCQNNVISGCVCVPN